MTNKRRTQAQWVKLIQKWSQTGQSAKQFCQENGLVLQTFHARRSDLKRGVTGHQSKNAKLVRIVRDKPIDVSRQSIDKQGVMMLRFNQCELHISTPQSPDFFSVSIKTTQLMKMFVEPDDIYLHLGYVDFGKSINGLLCIVENELESDAFSGALFIFCNKKQETRNKKQETR